MAATDQARQLQMLLDERDIYRQLCRFTRLLDERKLAELGTVFHRDIAFDYGRYGEHRGLDALEKWMHNSLDACGGTQHLIGNVEIEVTGDQAMSRAFVMARHQGANQLGGAIFDTNGEYIDRWVRDGEGGWRIIRRDAIWRVISGDPSIVGITELRLD